MAPKGNTKFSSVVEQVSELAEFLMGEDLEVVLIQKPRMSKSKLASENSMRSAMLQAMLLSAMQDKWPEVYFETIDPALVELFWRLRFKAYKNGHIAFKNVPQRQSFKYMSFNKDFEKLVYHYLKRHGYKDAIKDSFQSEEEAGPGGDAHLLALTWLEWRRRPFNHAEFIHLVPPRPSYEAYKDLVSAHKMKYCFYKTRHKKILRLTNTDGIVGSQSIENDEPGGYIDDFDEEVEMSHWYGVYLYSRISNDPMCLWQ